MKAFYIFFCLLITFNVFSKEPILIGLDADMTSVAKEGGVAIKRGAEIAIQQINKNGGVLGRPLKLVVKNHRGNPARGIKNLESFSKMENLVAVIGGVHTPVALKELPTIHKNQLIYLDPWAAGTPIVDNGYNPNFVFRVSVRDAEAAKIMVPHVKQRNLNKVALLLERTGWGRSNEKSLTLAAQSNEIEITKTVWFNWGQKEFNKEIASIIDSGAEAIFLVANAPEGVVFANSMLAHQSKLPIISHWGIAGGNFVEKLGLENLSKLDISVLQTYSFTHPYNAELNNKVLSQYRNNYGAHYTAESIPGAVGTAHAFDLVHILKKSIELANSLSSSQIRNALENIVEHSGLVKNYTPPFASDRHDALLSEDYIISRFNDKGYLIPSKE